MASRASGGFAKVIRADGSGHSGGSGPTSRRAAAWAFEAERRVLARCAGCANVVQLIGASGRTLRLEGAWGDLGRAGPPRGGAGEPFGWAWRLLACEHAARGLAQLHARHIVHRDLKASNVLAFHEGGVWRFAIGDLGRARARGIAGPFDDIWIAGDQPHAPPELHAQAASAGWFVRGLAADLFLLGSLALDVLGAADEPLAAAVSRRLYASPQAWAAVVGKGWTEAAMARWRREATRVITRRLRGLPRAWRGDAARVIAGLCEPNWRRRLESGAEFEALLGRVLARGVG